VQYFYIQNYFYSSPRCSVISASLFWGFFLKRCLVKNGMGAANKNLLGDISVADGYYIEI
jgi:hypothetical protein